MMEAPMRFNSLLLVAVVSAGLAACERPGEPATDSQPTAPSFQALPGDDWGPAVRLSSPWPNTAALEGCPHESTDGRSLYFASNRNGSNDIFVSHRDASGAWGEPVALDAVNSSANDYCPTPLPDGGLLFVSERNDGLNCDPPRADIYYSRRDPSGVLLPPEHLDCVVNGPGHEWSPSYVPAGGGMLFFSSSRTGKQRIYVSFRGPDGSWQAPQDIANLNDDLANSQRPNVSADGREIVFDSDRSGSRGVDIWYSYRATPHSEWAPPIRLENESINSTATEARASMSRNGKRLYFGSNRSGNFDIYVAERR
jgi:Tol biopolymer transport system component